MINLVWSSLLIYVTCSLLIAQCAIGIDIHNQMKNLECLDCTSDENANACFQRHTLEPRDFCTKSEKCLTRIQQLDKLRNAQLTALNNTTPTAPNREKKSNLLIQSKVNLLAHDSKDPNNVCLNVATNSLISANVKRQKEHFNFLVATLSIAVIFFVGWTIYLIVITRKGANTVRGVRLTVPGTKITETVTSTLDELNIFNYRGAGFAYFMTTTLTAFIIAAGSININWMQTYTSADCRGISNRAKPLGFTLTDGTPNHGLIFTIVIMIFSLVVWGGFTGAMRERRTIKITESRPVKSIQPSSSSTESNMLNSESLSGTVDPRMQQLNLLTTSLN